MPTMRVIALIFGIAFLISSPAYAVLRIDITNPNVEPLPIALPAPVGGSELGANILRVVAADLERSGLFRPIDPSSYIEQITNPNSIPQFASWRQINAPALVTSSITSGGGKIKASFRLWDTLGEQQVAGKEFNTFENNWRRMAHLMADEIYKRLTGEEGYFDTRVVYVAESGPGKKRVKRLAIMDQDGENHKFLTDGRNLVLTPRFSPNSQEIIYLAYGGSKPRVFLRDLQTGREEMLGRFEGMSFAPRFSSDGRKVLMSIARNGNTEIHEMDLGSRQMRQLTNDPSIDTSPSYSPDGRQIVFNSDRGGSQQLYVMNAGGGGVRRISFGDGRYGTPVWSPRGDWIACTKMKGGRFYIGIMRQDGSGERTLTESFLDEGPTWAPNGRVIMFNRQSPSSRGQAGASRLYTVDITGYNLRQVLTPIDASDPAWSPLLPL